MVHPLPAARRLSRRAVSSRSGRLLLGALAIAATLCLPASAQLSFGGAPLSGRVALSEPVQTAYMAPVDVAAYLLEDLDAPKNQPFRFGATLPVDLTPANSGTWSTLADGTRVWRLRIASDGAFSLGLDFGRFELPGGSQLFVYNDAMTEVAGAYDDRNNKENGEFAILPVPGDAITLEYIEPAPVAGTGRLALRSVIHDYRDLFSILKGQAAAGDASGACENDVNCPVGLPYADQKRAVTMLIIGGALCTGSLINNAANDGTQYFISAYHCGSLNNAVFRFGYEKSGCGTGSAPTNKTVQGSTQLYASSGLDTRFVRITESIPASYQPYYLGWDRSGIAPPSTVTIHHPAGDVKKISFDDNPPSKSGTQWKISQWDDGVTEGGSSGCALMTPAGRFIGQLYGGQATCSFPYNDYYGAFDQSWAGVKAWLDPASTGVTAIDGYDPAIGGGNPPTLTTVAPASVTAFLPAQVTLTGSGFTAAVSVTVGSATLTVGNFAVVNDTTITFFPPTQATLGAKNVTVTNLNGPSAAKTLTYTDANPPKLSASVFSFSGGALDWNWGGGSNDTAYLLYALSPATFSYQGFPILANFSVLLVAPLDAKGLGGLSLTLPAAVGSLSLYSEVVTFDGGGSGFVGASNITTTTVLF